ncbi:MAG: NADH-quinone oxidoreductase subunit NuoE [Ignavibacteriales bacterium]
MHSHIFTSYPPKDKSNLISLLQEVQNIYGYLPESALIDVAGFLEMPLSRIYGVATFYNQFRLKPQGKNVIRICRGTACHVKGSANLLFALETALNCKAGETTRDKNFTLETVACIGACSIAPVINVNNDYYGRATVKDIPKILKKYAASESSTEKIEEQITSEQ